MEFRNTDFKSPEQTVQQSAKTVKFNKTQRWLILPTFRLSSRARNRVADGIHISVITRCKSVVRLYQQSAIRSKRKMADEAFLHLIVGMQRRDASSGEERYGVSAAMGPRTPIQLPQGSRNWHIQSS